jgi:hypothetical protein
MGKFADKIAQAQGLYITWWTLSYKRKYVIDKIKAPLLKAITVLASRYPEPTKTRTTAKNTHNLLDIQKRFFEYENNSGRDALLRAIWRIFIIEYEHDKYYRHRIDWIIEEIVKMVNDGVWESREPQKPLRNWREFAPTKKASD